MLNANILLGRVETSVTRLSSVGLIAFKAAKPLGWNPKPAPLALIVEARSTTCETCSKLVAVHGVSARRS
jgi:hypothetical protein